METDIFRTEYEKLCSTLNDNINGKKDLVEWICQDKKSPKPNIEVDQNLIVPKVPVSKVGDVADQTYIGNAKVEFKGLKSAKYLIQQVGVYKLNKDTNKWEELKLNKDYTTKDTGEKIINDVSEGEKIEGKLAWTTNETGVVGINYVYYPSGYLPAKENGISNCKLLITGIDEGLEECDCRYFYKGHLFIPPTINVEGYGACEVNGIADNAFENNLEIKKVCLPDTMIYIGKKAFANCRNLENVYRPYTTHTINALKGINVNKCVADDAFEGIEHDIHIYGPREKYSDIFYSYAKNHNIIYIDSEMQGGILYKLDERAKTSSAIYFCRNSIGESAVTDNVNEWYPINDLNYSNDNDLILTSFYDKEEDQYYDLVSIGEQAFIYGLGFNNVEIPNTVKLIGYRAFEQCLGIITIFIPRETTQIQDTYLEKLDLTIRGYLGSEAEAFAKEHNIRFEEVNVKYRDISGDLKIDEEDIKALKEYIASKDELTPEQKKLADITGDGKLNINDVIKLKRYIKALTDEEVAQEHPDWLE